MSTLETQLRELHTQFRERPPLRLGLWLIAAILLLNLVLDFTDRAATARQQTFQLQQQIHRMQQTAADPAWETRALQARERLHTLEQELWRTDSRGMAQAEVQAWFQETAIRTGFQDPRIRADIALDVPGHDGIWQVTAQLAGSYQPQALIKLLEAIAAHEQLVVVERLRQRNQRGVAATQLAIRVFVLPTTEGSP